MRNDIPALIEIAHANSKSKGFWEDTDLFTMDRELMLIITEASEAVEAIRSNIYANMQDYHNTESKVHFIIQYENYIKSSFQDEMADICIRLFNFAGGFEINPKSIQNEYDKEIEALKGITVSNVPAMLFSICASVIDIKRQAFRSQYIGEVLARVHYIMDQLGYDLPQHIRLKMRYNAERPYKHGKSF